MPEPASSLAAMTSTLADGDAPTPLGHDVLRLKLIDHALECGIPWSVIGRALGGISGREAKRDAHRLRTRVRQAALAEATPARSPSPTP